MPALFSFAAPTIVIFDVFVILLPEEDVIEAAVGDDGDDGDDALLVGELEEECCRG